MASPSVIPTARGLVVCDSVSLASNNKVNVFGVHDGFHPGANPFRVGTPCPFARLSDGLGNIKTRIEVSDEDENLIPLQSVADRSLPAPALPASSRIPHERCLVRTGRGLHRRLGVRRSTGV
jgi:hypothetical protein